MLGFNKASVVLLLASFVGNVLASSDHMKAKPAKIADPCTNISQLAQLKCAAAPSAQFDQSGRLWLAWSIGGHVYVNHSDDKGKTFSSPVVVNLTPEAISAHGENRPKIAVDKSGRIYVSWTTPLKKRFTGHVRFSMSDDGGKHFSEPVIVNDNLDITGHRFDALGVTYDGKVYMAWIDKRDRLKARQKGEDYHGAAIYYAFSDNAGKTFQPNKKIIDHSCECCRVIVDFNNKQLPVILWRNIFGKNTRDHALVNFTSENTFGLPERVSFDNWQVDACPHHGPDMSINDNNDYHMVWFDNAPDRHGLFYARRNNDGSYTQSINFGNYKAAASHPNVLNIGGKVWIVWKEFDGKQESIWLQTSTDNGDNWNKPEIELVTSAGSDYPFLIKDNGDVYIQWQTKNKGFRLTAINARSLP